MESEIRIMLNLYRFRHYIAEIHNNNKMEVTFTLSMLLVVVVSYLFHAERGRDNEQHEKYLTQT